MSDDAPAALAPPARRAKERVSFECHLGRFDVVANATYVQAMSDERDAAEKRRDEAEEHGFEAVEAIHALGEANGGDGGPNYVKWTDAEPFGALTLGNTIGITYDRGETRELNMVTNIHHPETCEGRGADPAVSLFQTTFAFEALTGGTMAPLPGTWDAAALAEAQRIERLILGDAKADLAAKLTAGERAELKGIIVGVRSMARVLYGAHNVKDGDGKSSYDRLMDRVVGDTWMQHPGIEYAKKLTSELRASLQPGLAPALYTLLFTPDERPLLAYALARELYDHHGGDYAAVADTMLHAIARAWGLWGLWSNSTDEARQRATARLEDRAVPLEERLADLHVWMAEDARKEEREREEWAARKPSEEIKRRVERALRSEDNDRRKHAALRDKVQKTIQKHRK